MIQSIFLLIKIRMIHSNLTLFLMKKQFNYFFIFVALNSSKGKKPESKKSSHESNTNPQQVFSQPGSSADDRLRDDVNFKGLNCLKLLYKLFYFLFSLYMEWHFISQILIKI